MWAPAAGRVEVVVEGRSHPMAPGDGGWWRAEAAGGDGTRYAFRLDGGAALPDPRSRRQPDGPDGASAVAEHGRFAWRHAWEGRGLPGAVLYELHIGTFTAEGTFDAAAERLGHLARLGITHVELMPVCPFPGRHGWGYDGVAPWAVHEPYGGPEGLKRFVDSAHGHGLGVVLDVVHNHLGPSGNHLPAYGPYFTDAHQTPWGAAVNLDGPGSDEVRAYFLGSVLAWLRDYRIDGLRLDAVHELRDDRALHFLEELSALVDLEGHGVGRPYFLIAESDRNDPRVITPRKAGWGVHAQWNDDFHHALHTFLTGESHGYYADFAADPRAALTKTLGGGFFHDGTYSTFRGRRHGRPLPPETPRHRLVTYAQTHDQIGNRATGDRLAASLTAGQLAGAAALVLLSPATPMLFMGEEWGARTPWQYFTDHTDPELARAVREGRRREFAEHGWDAAEVPDPQDPATRDRSCLDWTEPERQPHQALLEFYRELIELRRSDPAFTSAELRICGEGRCVQLHRGPYVVAVNLGDEPAPLHPGCDTLLASWGDASLGRDLPPESVAVLR